MAKDDIVGDAGRKSMSERLLAFEIFESIVGNYLQSVKDAVVQQFYHGPTDFEIRLSDGSRYLIEVTNTMVRRETMARLAHRIASFAKRATRYKLLLVTPKPPAAKEQAVFNATFSFLSVPHKWIGVEELPSELGTPSPGDFFAPETMAKLQVSSLIGRAERYRRAPFGPGPTPPPIAEAEARKMAPLARQLSYRTLVKLSGSSGDLLRVAQRIMNVTVVLSDVVNFSQLVQASYPEDLREAMARYYKLARSAVFSHGGMLDKFIGDAVLAVFGYPISGQQDAVCAIKYAQELLNIGREVLGRWQENLNAIIETGTRIGIATGDLWPINIGRAEVEITLLGGTINLAARLEKNCCKNSLLMDNRTKRKACREDSTFLESLILTKKTIEPTEAKGQQFPIQAWATNLPDPGNTLAPEPHPNPTKNPLSE